MKHLERFIRQYDSAPKAIHNTNRSKLRKKLRSTLAPRQTRAYAPTPKGFIPPKARPHTMALRQKKYLYPKQHGPNYQHLALQYLVNNNMSTKFDMFNPLGKRNSIDNLLKEDIETWGCSLSNELGRLAGGIRDIIGNNAITFIHRNQVPTNKKYAYENMVRDYGPLKVEKYRVRLTIGGDVLEYENNASSPAASLLETKLLLNSVISDAHAGARFMTADLKDFFLQSFLEEPEYIRIHSKYFLPEIRQKYNIDSIIAPDGYVYCEIQKRMYGLKQAAKLARDQLVEHLKAYGYYPQQHAQNIWAHKTRRTKFCLCVDDFGIKYYSRDDAEHLISALKDAYTVTVDNTGGIFLGYT